jgi:hypothetical protein
VNETLSGSASWQERQDCIVIGCPCLLLWPCLLCLQAGGIVRVGVGGPWYAALPEEAWPQDAEQRGQILKDFQKPHGDRRWGAGAGAAILVAAQPACVGTVACMPY